MKSYEDVRQRYDRKFTDTYVVTLMVRFISWIRANNNKDFDHKAVCNKMYSIGELKQIEHFHTSRAIVEGLCTTMVGAMLKRFLEEENPDLSAGVVVMIDRHVSLQIARCVPIIMNSTAMLFDESTQFKHPGISKQHFISACH